MKTCPNCGYNNDEAIDQDHACARCNFKQVPDFKAPDELAQRVFGAVSEEQEAPNIDEHS